MEQNRCIFCMHEMDPDRKRCPSCKKGAWEYQWNSRWLRPYTRLNERYIIGRVLGEGAAGITYLAYDIQEDGTAAVKEYFPAGMAGREPKTQKVIGCGEREAEQFKRGTGRFLAEAQLLADKKDIFGVVEEKGYFKENDTVYIVMEYLSGGSLKEHLKKVRQVLPVQAAKILKPVMEALLSLHSDGIIHCDISPDNLLFDNEGVLKLIDLGAARKKGEVTDYKELKEGYAPPEQYQEKERIGPWTDVYAICAVWYEMVTGRKVPPAPERLKKDTLKNPSEYVKIQPELERIFMQGLSVEIQRRYFGIENLMGRIDMPGDNSRELSGQVRNEWGGLWVKITTQVERDIRKKAGHRIEARWLKRGGMICCVLLAVLLLAAGGIRVYCRENPWKVVEYEAFKDRKEAGGLTGYKIENMDSPEYKEDIEFLKKHAVSVQEDDEIGYIWYTITRKAASDWGKLSNSSSKFHVRTDTVKKALDVWEKGEKTREEASYFTGKITVEKKGKKSMVISLLRREEYQYGGNSFTVESDYNDHYVTSVTFTGAKKDINSFVSKFLPLLSPESYLTEDEIKEVLQYTEESASDILDVRLNAKCRLHILLSDADNADETIQNSITIRAEQ